MTPRKPKKKAPKKATTTRKKATTKKSTPQKTPKTKNGNRYSVKEWAKVRAQYESGEFKGAEDLFASNVKKGARCPSVVAIRLRMAKDGWDKAINEPAIQEAMHEKYLRIAREVGIDDKLVMEKLFKMLGGDKDSSAINMGLQRYMDLTGTKAPLKVARTDADGSDTGPDTVFVVPSNGFEPRKK